MDAATGVARMTIKLFDEGRVCNCDTCPKAGEAQPWDNFHKHKSSRNGHNTHCKVCRRKIHLDREGEKLKVGRPAKPKSLLSQCGKSWNSEGAAAFLSGKR